MEEKLEDIKKAKEVEEVEEIVKVEEIKKQSEVEVEDKNYINIMYGSWNITDNNTQ